MTTALGITIGAIFVLLALSAFFSGSETALTAASRARMHHLEKSGNKRARIVNQLLDMGDGLIGAILLGNNLVNILASALATSVLLSLVGDAGVAYATLIMTMLVLVFAEVMPKTYAITHPDRLALRVAPLIRLTVLLFAPVSRAVQIVVHSILKLFGVDIAAARNLLSAHEELRGVIDLHHQEGGVVKHHRDMLGGVLDLSDLEVSDVMVHRTNMVSVNADDPTEKMVSEILSSAHTRIPLWRNEPENIVGILHAKDLARALTEARGTLEGLDIPALATTPWFVPDTTMLNDQLNAFLRRKSHFALVVDEYGEVMGLVTLEDILEEIVGDIADEHDTDISGVRSHSDGTITVDGSVPIRDLNRAMDWNLPDNEATTVAGLVIHEARMIPEQGQAFTFHNFRFEVAKRQRNRITTLKIRPLRPAAQRAARKAGTAEQPAAGASGNDAEETATPRAPQP